MADKEFVAARPPPAQAEYIPPQPVEQYHGSHEQIRQQQEFQGTLNDPIQDVRTQYTQGQPNNDNGDANYSRIMDKLKVESLLSPNAPVPHSSSFSSLEDDGDDTIDFHKDNYAEPCVFSEGTLTWVTMLKKDIHSRALILCLEKENAVFNKIKSSTKEDHKFVTKFMAEGDFRGKIPEHIGKSDRKSNVLQMLKEAFKDTRLNWLLIDKFFNSELYCTLPILDRDDFNEQLSRIISPKDSKNYGNKLNVTARFHLATLGSALVLMRLASLTSYNAGKPTSQPVSESDQYIKDNPVTKDAITLAKRCLEEVLISKEHHIIIFQLNLLIQHYNFYAPEDCDCITASTITNMGPLLHSGISSGLNRDPTLARPKYHNPNLLRRLWFLLEYLDYYQLMLVGYAPIINHASHDTQIPLLDHNDSALQYSINEAFHDREKINEFCRPLLMMISNVKKPPKIRDVLNQMKKLEKFVENIPKYDELLRIPSDTVLLRFKKLRIHNEASDTCALLFMVYFNFFLHYNDKRDSEKSLYYLLQLLRLSRYLYSSVHFFRMPEKLNENFNLNDQFGVGILALPKIELCLHKIGEFMITFLGRIKAYKAFVGMNISDERLHLIDSIAKLTFKISFFLVDAFANLSDTYYHAWSMAKIQSFIVEKVFHNKEGRLDISTLSPIEYEYVQSVEKLRSQDDGFFLYSNQDLKQILSALELIDTGSLCQTPTPDSLLYDLNTYKSKNDRLWFDQMMCENGLNSEADTNFSNNSTLDSNNGGASLGNNNPTNGANEHPAIFDWDPFGTNSIADIEQMFHHTINDY